MVDGSRDSWFYGLTDGWFDGLRDGWFHGLRDVGLVVSAMVGLIC